MVLTVSIITMDGRRISAITMLGGKTYRGKTFIGATYVGDLMAAGIAIDHERPVQDVDYDELKKRLIDHKQRF